MALLTFYETEQPHSPEECKGLFYRGAVEIYIGSNGDYNQKSRMRPLRRKSCTGCSKCDWMVDHMNEMATTDCCYIPLEDVAHGALYELKVTGYSRDWETGYVDDVDVEFVKIDET